MPWEEWVEIASGSFGGLSPSAPDDVTWRTTFTSNRAGILELIELPEIQEFPEGTLSSAVFRFDAALNPGESFTLTKTLQYAGGDAGGGVQQLDVVNLPAALPLPPALGLFLAALAALSFMGFRQRP